MKNPTIKSHCCFLKKIAKPLNLFLILSVCFLLLTSHSKAQTLYNFNDTSDLRKYFNPTEKAKIKNVYTGGLNNTGALNFFLDKNGDINEVWIAKNGVSKNYKGEYTVSTYFDLSIISASIGFTDTISNKSGKNKAGAPNIGLGIQFGISIENRYSYLNNDSVINTSFNSESKKNKIDKDVDNSKHWVKVIFTLIPIQEDCFNIKFQIWNTDVDENITTLIDEGTVSKVFNAKISKASTIYPYFSLKKSKKHTSGYVNIDNFYSSSAAITTLDSTIIPDNVPIIHKIDITDKANIKKYGYGKWHYGPGLPCQKRLDLMPANYNLTSGDATHLLRFFTISDIHITDKESPAQALYFRRFAGQNAISVYSPLMLYTTQVLDATVQTINAIHHTNPFNFGLALGDMANSTQHNELRWFVDVLDGKMIDPHSARTSTPDSLLPDFQRKFQATGLDLIPWYATIGNHDHFWIGSKPIWSNPVNEKLIQAYTSDSILKLGNILNPAETDAINKDTYSTGTLDSVGNIIGEGLVSSKTKIKVIADTNRYSLSKYEWMKEFNSTTSYPKGHGFDKTKAKNTTDTLGACYSFRPIKVIVLDDTQDDNDAPYEEGVYGHGELNQGRYTWLINQLNAGQRDSDLMIISAHIPIGVVAKGSAMDWIPAPGYTSEKDLIAQLQSYPNLILWVAGHRHLNTVTSFPSADTIHPENSFWEVETKSLREFPEQFRTFDIALNSDTTISIITTNVDPEMKANSLAAIGRSYAIASNQIYGLLEAPQPTGSVSYNAELIKLLSPAMRKKVWKFSHK